MLSDLVHEHAINQGVQIHCTISPVGVSPHSSSYGLPYKIAVLEFLDNRTWVPGLVCEHFQ